jgi:tetratricopeptide (TPR) repeat protein
MRLSLVALRRRWRLLAVLAVGLAVAGVLAGPHLWALYHYWAARAALRHYHAEEARQHLSACLRVWPGSGAVHLLAAQAARRAGAHQEAEEHLRAWQRQCPDAEEGALEWALLRASQGELREVEGYLHDVAARDPERAPLAWEALAEGYTRMARVRDALRCLQGWLEHDPDNVQALSLRANVWSLVQSSPKAADDLRRVIELDPQRHEDRWRLARVLLDSGSYDEALTHLEEVNRRRPGDPDVLLRIARCHAMLGRGKKGHALLAAVLAEHPWHGLALRTRGQMALTAGRPAEAEKWLQRAVRALPHDYHSHYALFQSLRQQKKDKEAAAQLARAQGLKNHLERLHEIISRTMSERPNDPALYCELGTLLLRTGRADLGERWLIGALKLDANYRPAHAALADYYQAHGDADKAASHRKRMKDEG